MEKFKLGKKQVEQKYIECNNCKSDKVNVYPTKESDKFIAICINCLNVERITKQELDAEVK